MNQLNFTLTEEDWADLYEYRTQKSLRTNIKFHKQIRWISLLGGTILGFIFLYAAINIGISAAILMIIIGLIPAIACFYGSPITQKGRRAIAIQAYSGNARKEPVTVSLTPRGVLEKDSCEERLTLWDAITEVELTEKFLCAKDKRGGTLLIPMRAFGSESMARLFLLEIENHRMRHAVGLTPPATVAPTAQVIPSQSAPQQQVAAGWWRKPGD